MSSFIAHLRAIAQIDSDQWINFLILAIMAVLWLFATLLKAATKRKPSEDQQGGPARVQRETWQVRLARKAEELQRALEGPSGEAGERVPQRMHEKAGAQGRVEERSPGKITVRSGRGGKSVLVYQRAEPAADSTRGQHAARQGEAKEAVSAAGRTAMVSQAEPKLEAPEPTLNSAADELADMTLNLPRPPEPAKEGPETRREPGTGYDPASIIDSNDPDAIRKAILHYEILGKPIGLRDPLEQPSAF